MNTRNEPLYTIPARYRRMENSHILFWLLKDISWCLGWKITGMVMILPTLIISLIVAWRTRAIAAELAHNLAISLWITANSYWMIAEFYAFDEKIVFAGLEARYLAMIPFLAGVAILAHYYFIRYPRERKDETVIEL